MSEPLMPDTNASLTPLVRQFTRVARLAAADPLRLLPLDPLTQLAALGAPIAALLEIAPFERLREAMAGPAAARRGNVARGRPQPLSDRKAAVRTRTAALPAIPPSGEPPSDVAVPTAARQVTSARQTGPLSSAPQPPGREAASITPLAERRAAWRRVSAEPASRTQSTPAEIAHLNTGHGVSTAPSRAHEIDLPEARERNDDALDRVRHEEPATPFAARVLHEGAHAPTPIDERGIAARHNDIVVPPAGPASVDEPVGAGYQSTLHHARLDREASTPSAVGSSRSGTLPPVVARVMPQADANAGKQPRVSDPTTELELAEALFETLYREGVDLSWP